MTWVFPRKSARWITQTARGRHRASVRAILANVAIVAILSPDRLEKWRADENVHSIWRGGSAARGSFVCLFVCGSATIMSRVLRSRLRPQVSAPLILFVVVDDFSTQRDEHALRTGPPCVSLDRLRKWRHFGDALAARELLVLCDPRARSI